MTKQHDLSVPGVSCEHCVKAINGSVSSLLGVQRVDVNLERKMVSVVGGERGEIVTAIEAAGYNVD